MFLGYNLTNWLNLGLYGVFITVLFIVICVLSSRASDYMIKENIKRFKLKKIKYNR
jgi:hypothetical protein